MIVSKALSDKYGEWQSLNEIPLSDCKEGENINVSVLDCVRSGNSKVFKGYKVIKVYIVQKFNEGFIGEDIFCETQFYRPTKDLIKIIEKAP